jgi:hypothetical protein
MVKKVKYMGVKTNWIRYAIPLWGRAAPNKPRVARVLRVMANITAPVRGQRDGKKISRGMAMIPIEMVIIRKLKLNRVVGSGLKSPPLFQRRVWLIKAFQESSPSVITNTSGPMAERME